MPCEGRARAAGARGEPGPPEACDLLVRNGFVITVDSARSIFSRGAVAIRDGSVVAVGADAEIGSRFEAREAIDAAGAAVHPGFIEPHVHASLHSTRGTFPDLASGAAPYRAWYDAASAEDEYASGLHCALEALHNGFTAFMDPGSIIEPDAVARAATEVGVRSSVADPFLWDLPTDAAPVKRAPADRDRAMGLLGGQLYRNRDPRSLARGHVALYGLGTASDELTLAAKRRADEAGVTFTQHQSFTRTDAERDDRRLGAHPLVHLAEIGALGRNCTFVHMNLIRDDEMEPIVASGMSVAWHPANFQFYGVAAQTRSRMAELWERGTNLTVCTDVAKAWSFGDMGLLAYLVAREHGGFIAPEGIFEMQTIRAARAIGMEGVLGSIEVGKRADIVIRSRCIGEAWPDLDPIREITLIGRSKSVRTVIVDGQIVLRDGRAVRVDEDRVWKLAGESARRVAQRLGLGPPRSGLAAVPGP